MIRNLTINNFRGLRHLEISGLGRINLFVGTNNCGKTSVLEAIRILAAQGDYRSIIDALIARGESFFVETEQSIRPHVDIRGLFHGHQIELGSSFDISENKDRAFSAKVEIQKPESQPDLFSTNGDAERWVLNLKWGEVVRSVPITPDGFFDTSDSRRARALRTADAPLVQYISTTGLNRDQIAELWDGMVLTAEEDNMLDALRILEPNIERIASLGGSRRRIYGYTDNREGFVVKLKGIDRRVPVGTLGDGIWRLLGIAASLTHAKNGTLLVDEIDTGLHYRALGDMWRLVMQTAKRLNVQVFATTHSSDCWQSLGEIATSNEGTNEVTIQRIERNHSKAVSFADREVGIAVENGIEVR